MDDLIKFSSKYQRLLNLIPEEMTFESRMAHIRNMSLAAIVEIGEFLDELPWKPWKRYGQQEIDMRATVEELADVVIFLLNIYRMLDTDLSLGEVVKSKITKNIKRLESGEHTAYPM